MNQPKFSPGDLVTYTSLRKKGQVLRCINSNDPRDKALQGYRYYVSFRGEIWSITEQHLKKRVFVEISPNDYR